MVEPLFKRSSPALAQLAALPGDAEALRRLRADFDAAGAPPLAELAAAAVHLIERIAEGSVHASAGTTLLLGEAWAGLGEDLDEAARVALVERLDACASGFGDEAPAETDGPPTRRAEPPLLTIRADGSTVLPGTFEPAPAIEPAPVAAAHVVPSTLPAASAAGIAAIGEVQAVATALGASCDELAAQVGTLELLAGEELRRLVSELSATSAAIDRQRRALADWLAANAPPAPKGGAAGD